MPCVLPHDPVPEKLANNDAPVHSGDHGATQGGRCHFRAIDWRDGQEDTKGDWPRSPT